MTGRGRAAAAGAAAAVVWGLAEPLDKRAFSYDYSDIALLGKAVTRGGGWRILGYAMHAANGALFGLGYEAARRRTSVPPVRLGVGLALLENTVLYPLTYVLDRRLPARGEPGVPPLANARAYAPSTWRHALFGYVLARLAR